MAMSRTRYRYWLLLVIPITLAFIPINRVLIADWTLTVVDQRGTPLTKVLVAQAWHNYTYDLSGSEEKYTDPEGRVMFQGRHKRASFSYWVLKAVETQITYGAHASSGTVGYVRILDPRMTGPNSTTCSNDRCTTQEIQSQMRVDFQ